MTIHTPFCEENKSPSWISRLDWHTELELPNEEERRTLWGQCLKSTPHEAELTAETLAANHPARKFRAVCGRDGCATLAWIITRYSCGHLRRMAGSCHGMYEARFRKWGGANERFYTRYLLSSESKLRK